MERALPFFPSVSWSLSFWSGQRLCWLLLALRPDFLLWKCVFPHSILQSSGENKNTSHVVFASTEPTISQLQTTVLDLHRAEREILPWPVRWESAAPGVDGFQEEHSHNKCPLSQEHCLRESSCLWFVSVLGVCALISTIMFSLASVWLPIWRRWSTLLSGLMWAHLERLSVRHLYKEGGPNLSC